MSLSDERQAPHEIVIIRRRGGAHDDGHHGGAWKIAFADFMTAMMCFFLVMWLINATDKKTVTQIATYFNPLRLNDRLPTAKGLHAPSADDARPEHQASKGAGLESAKRSATSGTSEESKAKHDKRDKKARQGNREANGGDEPPSGDEIKNSQGGMTADQELLRNPFDVLDRIARATTGPETAKVHGFLPDQGVPLDHLDPASRRRMFADVPKPHARLEPVPSSPTVGDPAKSKAASATPQVSAHVRDDASSANNSEALRIEERLVSALADLPRDKRPHIEVEDLKLEILVSITDDFDFGMFAIASARPTRDLVIAMERIAQVLAETSGGLAIRGHTDRRPFRTPENDNWRLSMARAQVAFYMLMRAGLPQNRILRLEGHADQSLKLSDDPLSARNRRIDILIQKERS